MRDIALPHPPAIRWRFVLQGAALLLLFIIGNLHAQKPLVDTLRALTGRAGVQDVMTDMYGFRAMVHRWDPYPRIDIEAQAMGLEWRDATIVSTHPPTAYLLTAPVALLPWPVASMIWAWLMLIALALSLRLMKLPAYWLLPVILWPPAGFSLGQTTILWLLGVLLAQRDQDKPFRAGLWLGFASLVKFMPGLLLIPFLLKRQWKALAGFATVWIVGLLIVTAIEPSVIPQYVEANRASSALLVSSPANASLLAALWSWLGWQGLLVVLMFLFTVWKSGTRSWHVYEYLTVALLPLVWVYSLLPLVPGIVEKRRHPLVFIALVLTFMAPPFGPLLRYFYVPALWLLGIAVSMPDVGGGRQHGMPTVPVGDT